MARTRSPLPSSGRSPHGELPLLSPLSNVQFQGPPGFVSVYPPVPKVHHVGPYCFGEIPIVVLSMADSVAPQASMPGWQPSVAGLFAAIPPCLCNLEVPHHLTKLVEVEPVSSQSRVSSLRTGVGTLSFLAATKPGPVEPLSMHLRCLSKRPLTLFTTAQSAVSPSSVSNRSLTCSGSLISTDLMNKRTRLVSSQFGPTPKDARSIPQTPGGASTCGFLSTEPAYRADDRFNGPLEGACAFAHTHYLIHC